MTAARWPCAVRGHGGSLTPVMQYSPDTVAVEMQGQYSTQYSTVQYSTVQYSTVQYSKVQYSTVQDEAHQAGAHPAHRPQRGERGLDHGNLPRTQALAHTGAANRGLIN